MTAGARRALPEGGGLRIALVGPVAQSIPPERSGSVVVSTLLTFACLPALIWAALAISDGAGLYW